MSQSSNKSPPFGRSTTVFISDRGVWQSEEETNHPSPDTNIKPGGDMAVTKVCIRVVQVIELSKILAPQGLRRPLTHRG